MMIKKTLTILAVSLQSFKPSMVFLLSTRLNWSTMSPPS